MSNKCNWFIGPDLKPCNKNKQEDSDYCKTHLFVAEYTEEEKEAKKHCSSCKKVLYIPDGQKTCGCAEAKIKKLAEKRRDERQPHIEKKLEEQNNKLKEKQRLINEMGYILCGYCDEVHPPTSFIGTRGQQTQSCENCREIQKERDARRTKQRDWSQEYKNNPALVEKKKQWKADNRDKQREYERKYKESKKGL